MDHEKYYYCVPERAGDTSYNIKYAQQDMDSSQRASNSSTNFSPDYRQHVVSKIQTLIMKIGLAEQAPHFSGVWREDIARSDQ